MYDVPALISALADFLELQTEYKWRIYKNRDSVAIERITDRHRHSVYIDYNQAFGEAIYINRLGFNKDCPQRKFDDFQDPNLLQEIAVVVDRYLTK